MNGIQRALAPARPRAFVVDPAGWHADEAIAFGGGEYRYLGGAPELQTRRIAAELTDGVGFAVVRGFPEEEAAVQAFANYLTTAQPFTAHLEHGAIVSAVTLHNEVRVRQPALLAALYEAPALFTFDDGRFAFDAGALTAARSRALAPLLEALAYRPQRAPGDLLIVNPRVVYFQAKSLM